jgi:hypothetical protein
MKNKLMEAIKKIRDNTKLNWMIYYLVIILIINLSDFCYIFKYKLFYINDLSSINLSK